MNLASGVWALGVWAPTVWAQCVWMEPGCAVVVPPTPPAEGGSAGGGRYYSRHFAYIPYEKCQTETRKLRAEKKRLEKRITAVEREIKDKEDRAAYEFNMAKLNRFIAELTLLQEKLMELQRMMEDLEDEEAAIIAACYE